MSKTSIKSGDTAIEFTATLTRNNVPVNLTSSSVKFLLRNRATGTAFSATATIVVAAAGTVSYEPGVGFPTTAGNYSQEWEVTFPDTTVLTFPSAGYNTLVIEDDLN
jgi:hypothetical protein